MGHTSKNRFLDYLIPGFVFQSILIGGGYGTGVEIFQYFGRYGLVGGLLGMAIVTVLWSALCAVTYELCRVFQVYDYKSLMNNLTGKISVLYDVAYVVQMFIVLGVVSAAAGTLLRDLFGCSQWVGIGLLSATIALLVLKGTKTIEFFLTFWSLVLYFIYFLFMIIVFIRFHPNILAEFAKNEIGTGWYMGALQYTFYNLCAIPATLFTLQKLKTRSGRVTAGIFAGIIGILPGVLLLLLMSCNLPEIASKVSNTTTPISLIFRMLDKRWLFIAFNIVLFGTLIETGIGFIKAFDDRVEFALIRKGKKVAKWVRPVLTFGLVFLGIIISTYGLLDLVAQGYGTTCWLIFITYVVPILTLGVYRAFKKS